MQESYSSFRLGKKNFPKRTKQHHTGEKWMQMTRHFLLYKLNVPRERNKRRKKLVNSKQTLVPRIHHPRLQESACLRILNFHFDIN